MSQRCYNWQPGIPPTAVNGADLDALSVSNAKISGMATTKLSGTITNAQLAGVITNANISGMATTKLQGTVTNAQISGMATSKLQGTVTNTQLAGGITNANISGLATTKLQGTVTNAQVSGLATTKLSGLITNAQVSGLATTKLTGTVTNAQISGLATSKLSGTVTNAQLAGVITNANISGLATTKLSGLITNAQASGIATTKLQGTVTNGQLGGSITSDKLSKPYSLFVIGPVTQLAPAVATGLAAFQGYGAFTILEAGCHLTANGTAASTIIDVHAGPNRASSVTVFDSTKLKLNAASDLITKVAAPSGTLGAITDDYSVWVDIDAVASGTKSNLSVWLVCKELPVA